MEKVEREVAKARSHIVDHELKSEKASRKEKETRVLSRAVERTERSIIDYLEANLTLKGWTISTLIHDEIVIQQPEDGRDHHASVETLTRDAKLIIRNFEMLRGWAPGTLGVNLITY